MELYLKKDAGDVYGPVALSDLAGWAAEGRIAPEDTLSPDQSDWRPAPSFPELGMEWVATLSDGATYGPIHLHALIELVQEGLVEPGATIRHTRADEQHILSEALLSVLIENNEGLRNSIATLHEHLAEARDRETAAASAAEAAREAAAAQKELAARVDTLRKELKTAKTSIADGQKKLQDAEADARAHEEQHQQALTSLETRLDQSTKTVDHLKQELESARAAASEKETGEDEAKSLRRQVESLKAERDTLRDRLQDRDAEAPAPPAEYKELATANDELRKDLAKWRNMYDTERENAVKRESALNERIDELRRSEASAVVAQDELSRRLRHTRRSYEMIVKAAENAEGKDSVTAMQLAVLMESHNELSQSYDGLFTQLQQKTEALNRLMSERKETETRTMERLSEMEAALHREQEEADTARKQLADMQQSHFQLVKSYREMNDQFIRFRQLTGQSEAPPVPPAASGSPSPVPAPEKPSSKGPRIRLNR